MFAHLLAIIFTFIIGVLGPSHKVLASVSYTPPSFHSSISPISVTPSVSPNRISPQQAIPSQTPMIDCIGPDSKHMQTTQQSCAAFNAAWHHNTDIVTPPGDIQKIGEHTYTMQFIPDAQMASAMEIFQALNLYRQKNSVSSLIWDTSLISYATSRADFYSSVGKLDDHAGFIDYVNNHNGFSQLGFNKLGENAAIAGPLSATHLIEKVYAGDPEHNANQLNVSWTHIGIGVHGTFTDIIFGGLKRSN